MTTLTERQQKALSLKGSHKIYFENPYADAPFNPDMVDVDEDMKFVRIIANLDEVEVISRTPEYDDIAGRAYIPDSTPEWLYSILDLWDAEEFMESYFEFESEEDIMEFKAICDDVNE